MFNETMNDLAEAYGYPTNDDIARAMAEMQQLAEASDKFRLSQYPQIQAIQARCFAYKYVHQRNNAGIVPPTPEELEANRFAEQVEAERAVSRKMMGANTIYSEVSLSDPATRETKVIHWLRESFSQDEKKSAVITGGVGSGKTYGAIAYISSVGQGAHPQFVTAYKLCELLNRRQYDELAVYEHARYLIIDDLGIQSGGYKADDFGAWFQDMFAQRHLSGLTTIITSNLAVDDLKEAYGERFVSRLRENGRIFVTDEGDLRNERSK